MLSSRDTKEVKEAGKARFFTSNASKIILGPAISFPLFRFEAVSPRRSGGHPRTHSGVTSTHNFASFFSNFLRLCLSRLLRKIKIPGQNAVKKKRRCFRELPSESRNSLTLP